MLLGSAAQSAVCQNAVPNAVPKSTVPGNEVEPAAAEGDPGQMLFQAMCSACHLPDRMHVGPSLVEIAGLYRDKRGDFLAWCKEPKQKRQGVIQMPSMAVLTDEHLTAVHGYILATTTGMTEVVVKDADRFRASPSMRRRPQVQRLFMPDCGPAAIAVAMDERFHYCFDAGACRLRYIWKGDFIDGWPVWRGNGNALAKVVGEVMLRETHSPFETGSLGMPEAAPRKFLGYRLQDGLPTFRYRIGELEVAERITPSRDQQTLVRSFVVKGAGGNLKLTFASSDKVRYRSADGTFAGSVFTPAPDKQNAFAVIVEEQQ